MDMKPWWNQAHQVRFDSLYVYCVVFWKETPPPPREISSPVGLISLLCFNNSSNEVANQSSVSLFHFPSSILSSSDCSCFVFFLRLPFLLVLLTWLLAFSSFGPLFFWGLFSCWSSLICYDFGNRGNLRVTKVTFPGAGISVGSHSLTVESRFSSDWANMGVFI